MPPSSAERVRLVALEMEDFGLIARAELAFSDGLTVCSGETGSGKTMLLGALGFALGDRIGADAIRGGAERARVTLALETDEALRARFADEGFELEAGEMASLARELGPGGKSTARINGRLATAAGLRALGDAVVERVGQHEQQRLLAADYALGALDAFAGPPAAAARDRVAAAHAERTARAAELAALSGGAAGDRRAIEDAAFALAEIDAVAPKPAEDVALRERRDYLASGERIAAALASARDALGREGAALETLGDAAAALEPVAGLAPALGALRERLRALQGDAQDAAVAVARELDGEEFDPTELEAAAARLDALDRLRRRYGGSLEAVATARAAAQATIDGDATRDARAAAARTASDAAGAALADAAAALSAIRAAAARDLEARIAAELTALAMPAARFAIGLEPLAEATAGGAERAVFALSPNPGEPLRPLGRAASGGELSRVLLALAVALAATRPPGAVVFDEIDAGIGGATATAVGTRIGALATRGQVLCVTHLAQLAAFADGHYALRKRETAGATVVELVALRTPQAVLEELARMLSGDGSRVALDHAGALLRSARGAKADRPTAGRSA